MSRYRQRKLFSCRTAWIIYIGHYTRRARQLVHST